MGVRAENHITPKNALSGTLFNLKACGTNSNLSASTVKKFCRVRLMYLFVYMELESNLYIFSETQSLLRYLKYKFIKM
jgi:hypothetical protein